MPPRHGRAPVAIGLRGRVVPAETCAREEPHRLAERQAFRHGTPLNRFEPLERSAQPVMVDLDPLAADKGKPVGLR
jgi:hypothetical protein